MSQLPTRDDKATQVATRGDLRRCWLETMQVPVQAIDGKVFQFDLDSERLMQNKLIHLQVSGQTTDWRLNDNTTVTVDYTQLKAYFDELLLLRAGRGTVIDAEYMAKKILVAAGQLSIRDLEDWKASHTP